MRQGDTKKRFDAHYYQWHFRDNETRILSKFPNIQRLDNYAEVFCGPFGTEITSNDYVSSGVPLLRISNITKEGLIDDSEILFISEEKASSLASTQVKEGDLVVSQRGTLGMPAVVSSNYTKWNISANLIAIRNLNGLLPSFVQIFLSSKLGKLQLERCQSGQVQGKITTEDVASILIPNIKNQEALASEMETARAKRQSTLAEAESLLQGIDTFVLDELGLKLPTKQPKKPFAVKFEEIKKRTDPDYHSPYFRQLRLLIQNSKHKTVKLKDILAKPLSSGFAAGRNDQADDNQTGVPHVRPFNISPNGQFQLDTIKYVPNENVSENDWLAKGEVLFNNTNSTEWVGKTAVFNSDEKCACSNHITRIFLDKDKAEPIFIAALLNAFRSLGLFGLLSTNFNNQAGINSETLLELEILLPPLPLQRNVVTELETRRAKARQLREKAESLWQEAKEKFEKALLG